MNKLFSMSIKSQLFFIVFTLAFFAAGIIVYSGISFRNEKISEAIRDSSMLADSVANEHEKMVADARQLMLTLSQLPEIKRLNAARIQQVLKDVLSVNPKYSNIFIADRAGRVLASAVPAKDTNVSDRRYFINALATGRLSSGEYTISRFTGKSVLPFCYPFKNRRGEILGVIVMGIDLTYYRTVLDTLQLPSGSSYLLLDHKGIIMTRGINPNDFVGQQYNPAGFKRMVDGPARDTFVSVAHDGVKRFISYRKIRLEEEQGPYMYIRSGIPVASALAGANTALVRNLALLTSSLCFVVVFVWLIAKHSIMDRIALLEKASQRLADGDIHVKVSDLVAGGELGRLGLTFDHMARQIAIREDALEQKTLEQNAILENALVGIAFLKDRQVVWINNKMEQMFGYRMSEVSGLTTELFYPSRESYEQLGSEAYPVLSTGGNYYSEGLMKRKDGPLFWCSISGKPIDPSGLSKGAIWVLQDITERKQAEEAKDRLIKAISTASEGIAITDDKDRFIYVNDAHARIYGYIKDEIMGMTWRDIATPDLVPLIEKILSKTLHNMDVGFWTGECPALRKDGTLLPTEITANSSWDETGNYLGHVCIVRDTTERKKAEEQIEQSLREKETLLRELYHRTKNNMQVITSLLNLQSRDIDDKKILQIFEDTKNRIRSMSLVHEKLYKTKNLSQVLLGDYIKDLADTLMTSHHADKKQICLHIEADIIPVSIDTITPLGLVINELMTNALKYAFSDNKKGEIRIKAALNEDKTVELTFSDNGIGMPDNIDLEKTASLGLKIVRTLVVSQIKGNLELKTQNGTTFIIRFRDKGIPERI